MCRKLVGHFPVCDWLRVAMVDIKRCAASLLSEWDKVHDATLGSMLTETVARVTQEDPV